MRRPPPPKFGETFLFLGQGCYFAQTRQVHMTARLMHVILYHPTGNIGAKNAYTRATRMSASDILADLSKTGRFRHRPRRPVSSGSTGGGVALLLQNGEPRSRVRGSRQIPRQTTETRAQRDFSKLCLLILTLILRAAGCYSRLRTARKFVFTRVAKLSPKTLCCAGRIGSSHRYTCLETRPGSRGVNQNLKGSLGAKRTVRARLPGEAVLQSAFRCLVVVSTLFSGPDFSTKFHLCCVPSFPLRRSLTVCKKKLRRDEGARTEGSFGDMVNRGTDP